MRRKTLFSMVAAGSTFFCAGSALAADAIPYPNSGNYNPATYRFTATTTGDLIGYFISGGSAGYDNQVGVLDNGAMTSGGFGLDNHSSSYGQSFDFGPVTAGDTLTFVMKNLSLGANVYSNPALNVAYDDSSDTLGHDHVYSTTFSGSSSPSIPAGTYVAFEDLPFPGADFNYNDEAFVFGNTLVNAPVSAVPEPAAWGMMMLGVGAMGFALRRRQKVTTRVNFA